MLFKEIIGQQAVKQRLIQSVRENRISHAQLLQGPEGSGNLALAIAYAQYISCTNRQENDSCGVCPSCKKMTKLIHPDLHFVYPVATTKKITKDPLCDHFINDWRTCILANPYIKITNWYDHIGVENKQGIIRTEEGDHIIRKLNFKSYESEYKTMIFWMPDKMNIEVANKLLKLIEEPPAKTLLVFVAESTENMLATILSRTQIVKIPKIHDDDLTRFFEQHKERYSLQQQDVISIVRLANGNFLKALEVVDSSEENTMYLDLFATLMRNCYARKVLEMIAWTDTIANSGREKQKSFLSYALRMIRENFVLNIANPEKSKLVFLTQKELQFAEKFSRFITPLNVSQISDELNKAQQHIERNGYDKIIFLDLALKITKLIVV